MIERHMHNSEVKQSVTQTLYVRFRPSTTYYLPCNYFSLGNELSALEYRV